MWDVTTGRTLRKFHGHIQVQQPFPSRRLRTLVVVV